MMARRGAGRVRATGLGTVLLAAAGSVAALALPRASAAASDEQPTATPSPPPPRRLEVILVGPEPSWEALNAALAPILSADSRITWKREDGLPAPAEGGAQPAIGPGIWIEARPGGSIRIVAIAADGQPAVRVVDGAAPSPVTAEIVAQIVRQTAESMLAHDAAAAERDAAPARVPQTIDQPTASTAPTLRAGPSGAGDGRTPLTYVAGVAYVSRTIFADNAFRQTANESHKRDEAGFAASFFVLTRAAPFGFAGGVLLDRATSSTPAGGGNVSEPALDITRWSSRMMVGPVYRPHQVVEVALALGGGVDRVAAQAGITGGGAEWLAAAKGMLRLSILLPGSGLEFDAAATLDVMPRTYFAQDIYGPLYSARPVHPGFSIGLAWRR